MALPKDLICPQTRVKAVLTETFPDHEFPLSPKATFGEFDSSFTVFSYNGP